MENPGTFNLGDFSIGSSGTQTGIEIDDLDGMTAVTISARMAYGSGGSTCVVKVETSLNQSTTWIEIAEFDFTTAGAEYVVNLSGLTSRTTPLAIVPLSSAGCNDGILGDRLRATVTSTGTYAGSTVVSVRVAAR